MQLRGLTVKGAGNGPSTERSRASLDIYAMVLFAITHLKSKEGSNPPL